MGTHSHKFSLLVPMHQKRRNWSQDRTDHGGCLYAPDGHVDAELSSWTGHPVVVVVDRSAHFLPNELSHFVNVGFENKKMFNQFLLELTSRHHDHRY